MRTIALAAAAALLALGFAGPADAESPRTETHAYVVGLNPVVTLCGDVTFWTQTTDVGGACFLLDGTESAVHLASADRMGWVVGGEWRVRMAPGVLLASGAWCGEADIALPTAAGARLYVAVGGVGGCKDDPSAGPGTIGTVTATFT